MHIQTCVYMYVYDHDIQTSYRLNTKTILSIGESHTFTLTHIHANSDLSVYYTDMYVSDRLIQTCL
jgi:HSP90 family molecular chaperone